MSRLKHFYFIPLLFFLLVSSAKAQQEDDSITYVQKYKDKFNLRLLLKDRPTSLELRNTENVIEYRPNTRPLIGIGANIVDLGFVISFKLPERFGHDSETYGQTDFHDYQVNFYLNNFAFDLQYQDYEGFYMTNTGDWEDRLLIPEDPIPLRDNLSIRGGTLNAIYIINPEKISLRAAFNNAEKQQESAGSFMVMTSINHFRIASDSLLVPAGFREFYPDNALLQQAYFTGIALMPGYTQSFTVRDFYLNLTVAAGPDIQYKDYETSEAWQKDWTLQGKINIRGAVGYDNGRFFTAIHFIDERNKYRGGSLDIIHNTGFIRFGVGHRFQDTRWMESIRNWELYQTLMNLL